MTILNSKRPGWRTLRWLPAVLAIGLLAGCSAEDPFQDLPAGGVDGLSGPLVIDDVWIDGPQGLEPGADAALRLTVTNESATTADTLVGVSTPAARRAVLLSGGHTVSRIVLGADSQTDLEWATGVELEGTREHLIPGQAIPVTFTFAQAGPVTVQVNVGPLAASEIPTTSNVPPASRGAGSLLPGSVNGG
ncbi:copper chaperone PCu(A)C [Streptomyces sp. SID13031]|uniref:copper chaperone PCu(A)C n=1 Tax=Streptomyces sp. SID13031 TaxID=2706046 RepID=UPI0013C6BC6A|nr:copper chaperone PCu(A)C [Streptomyces sp. SID13031]NEA30745.1 copper chaperone PCu(A)C [Streptomyces sp. SID13031]